LVFDKLKFTKNQGKRLTAGGEVINFLKIKKDNFPKLKNKLKFILKLLLSFFTLRKR